jgi:hypothetical protein
MIKLDERMSITKKTAIEAVSISVTKAKDSIEQIEPQKAEKYSDAAPGPLRSTRISSLRYQRSRVKPTKTSLKFNPVSPFLVKTARLQAGRGKFKAIKKFFGICRDELDPLQARPSAIFAQPKSQLACSRKTRAIMRDLLSKNWNESRSSSTGAQLLDL